MQFEVTFADGPARGLTATLHPSELDAEGQAPDYLTVTVDQGCVDVVHGGPRPGPGGTAYAFRSYDATGLGGEETAYLTYALARDDAGAVVDLTDAERQPRLTQALLES